MIIVLTQAKVQKEMLSKRSNWTEGKFSQACAQQPSQVDCNIKLTHPTRTIQKLAEDLSEGKSKPSSTFFRKVLDTYCNKTFLKKSITCNNKQNLQFLSYSYNLIDLGSCSLQTQLLNL